MTLPFAPRARQVSHPSLPALLEALMQVDLDRVTRLGPQVSVRTVCPPEALRADPDFQVHAIEVRLYDQVQGWAVICPHGREGVPQVWDVVGICPRRWRLLDDPQRLWVEVPLRPRAVRDTTVTAALAPLLMALGLTDDVSRVAGHLSLAA